MKRWILLEASYIASTLLAPGSVVTEEDLGPDTEPGRALVEVDENHQPVTEEGHKALLQSGVVPAGITQIAPVNPHAPNPTRPQSLPPRAVNEPALADDRGYVPAQGVQSNAAGDRQQEQTDAMIERHAETLSAGASATPAPDKPTRRGTAGGTTGGPSASGPSGQTGQTGVEPGPLDASVPDLVTHLETVTDAATLSQLRAAEVGGKSRKGALDAIDARIAALNSDNGGGSKS